MKKEKRRYEEEDYSILNYSPIGMFVVDMDYSVLFWNTCAEKWTGIEAPNIVGKDIRKVFPRFNGAGYQDKLQSTFRGVAPGVLSDRLQHDLIPSRLPSGEPMIHHTMLTSLPSACGKGYYAFLSFEDVTGLAGMISQHNQLRQRLLPGKEQGKEAKQEAIAQMKTQQDFLDSVADGIIITDRKFRISRCNRSVKKVLGYEKEELVGKFADIVLGQEETRLEVRELFDRKEWEEHVDLETKLTRGDGKEITAHISAAAIFEPGGEISGIVAQIRDISKHVGTLEFLKAHATRDPLTGVSNRRYFMELLDQEVESARRYKYELSLCICDLDKYKQVNDTYGHTRGDDVLVKFCEIMKEGLRQTDAAGRFGGDEFLILMPHTGVNGALKGVERIRETLEAHRFDTGEGGTFSITASFGLVELTDKETNGKDLLEAADKSLYLAKAGGGNSVVVR